MPYKIMLARAESPDLIRTRTTRAGSMRAGSVKIGPLNTKPFAQLLEVPEDIFLGCSDSIPSPKDVDTKSIRKLSAQSKRTATIVPAKTKLKEILVMNI
jgi:hypothetical protein